MHLFVPYQSTHAQFCSSFRPGNTWRDSSLYLKKTLEEKGGHCSRACTADLHPREIRRLWTEIKRQQNTDGRFTTNNRGEKQWNKRERRRCPHFYSMQCVLQCKDKRPKGEQSIMDTAQPILNQCLLKNTFSMQMSFFFF